MIDFHMMNYINRMNGEKLHGISVDAEKNILQKSNILIKTLNELGRERNFLNLIKAIYEKPMSNIPKGERLNVFPLRSGKS